MQKKYSNHLDPGKETFKLCTHEKKVTLRFVFACYMHGSFELIFILKINNNKKITDHFFVIIGCVSCSPFFESSVCKSHRWIKGRKEN